MFAIVETSGKQYRVSAGDTIQVDRLSAEQDSTITLDRVLLIGGERGRRGGRRKNPRRSDRPPR